jgi:hypothetical protein
MSAKAGPAPRHDGSPPRIAMVGQGRFRKLDKPRAEPLLKLGHQAQGAVQIRIDQVFRPPQESKKGHDRKRLDENLVTRN